MTECNHPASLTVISIEGLPFCTLCKIQSLRKQLTYAKAQLASANSELKDVRILLDDHRTGHAKLKEQLNPAWTIEEEEEMLRESEEENL